MESCKMISLWKLCSTWLSLCYLSCLPGNKLFIFVSMDDKFEFYKPLPISKGNGFTIPDGTQYIYDEYGGFEDGDLWFDWTATS